MLLNKTFVGFVKKYGTVGWQLLRVQTYILFLIYISFGYSIAAYSLGAPVHNILLEHWPKLGLLALAIGFWYISSTGINDYADYKIDQINLSDDKQRPIMQKIVTRQQLLKFSLASAGLSIILVLLIGDMRVLALFGLTSLLHMAYSVRPLQISHRGIAGPLLLPIGYVFLPVYSVFLVCGAQGEGLALLVLAGLYVHFFARIVLKDFRDVIGDKKFGKKTVLIQLGQTKVCHLAMAAFVLSTAIFAYGLKLANLMIVMAVSLGFGLTILIKLSELKTWPHQRVAIMMFGRICTMLVCVIIFGVSASTEGLSQLRINIVTACIVAVFLLSMEDIIRFSPANAAASSRK